MKSLHPERCIFVVETNFMAAAPRMRQGIAGEVGYTR